MSDALDLELIKLYTGGFNMPTLAQATANYVPIATVLADGSVNLTYVAASTLFTVDSAVLDDVEDGLTARQDNEVVLNMAPGGGSGTNGEYLATDFTGALGISTARYQVIVSFSSPGLVEIASLPINAGKRLTWSIANPSSGRVRFKHQSVEEATVTQQLALAEGCDWELVGTDARLEMQYWRDRWRPVVQRQRPTERLVTLVDEFMSAGGELGWDVGGVGSPTLTRKTSGSLVASMGTSTLSTSAASSDTAYIRSGILAATYIERMVWLLDIPTITSVSLEFGAGLDVTAASLGNAALSFRFDPSVSANWRTVTRNSATETVVDSGIAVVANKQVKFEIIQASVGASIKFLINGVLVATHTTNIPTAGAGWLSFGARLQTNTTAARTANFDRFEAEVNFGSAARYE